MLEKLTSGMLENLLAKNNLEDVMLIINSLFKGANVNDAIMEIYYKLNPDKALDEQ